MSWSYHKKKSDKVKDVWSIEEPSSKKRRVVEEEEDVGNHQADDWGDVSLELTQADIESLDIVASQALGEPPVSENHPPVEDEFARPHNPIDQPSTSHKLSSSSSDSSSKPRSILSLSSKGGSSHSLSFNSSKDEMLGEGLLKAQLDKKEKEVRDAMAKQYQSDGEVKFLRQTLEKKEAEIAQLRSEKMAANEQWKQKQAEKEKKLKIQLEKLTSESQFKEREHQEALQVFEKRLKDKDGKLKVKAQASPNTDNKQSKTNSPQKKAVKPSPPSKQLQAQGGDEAISSSQLRDFPNHLSFMERPTGVSPKAKPSPESKERKAVSCQDLSKEYSKKVHPKKGKMRRLQLKASNDIDSGPTVVSTLIRPTNSALTEAEAGLCTLLQALSTSFTVNNLLYSRNKDNSLLSPIKPHRRLLGHGADQLSSCDSSSQVQVVSADNFNLAVHGLDMLLHSGRTTSLSGQTRHTYSQSHRYVRPIERDKETSRNNPKDNSSIPPNPPPFPSSSTSLPTEPTNYTNGSIPSASTSLTTNTNTTHTTISSFISPPSKSTITTTTLLDQTLDKRHPHYGAVLILPLLYDYLQYYHHLVVTKSTVVKSPVNTPVSQSNQTASSSALTLGSSSYDSSLDSLNSSVLQLLQEGKVHAMTMERYAIVALQTLCNLVELCPSITSALAHQSLGDAESSSPDKTPSAKRRGSKTALVTKLSQQKSESGTDADDEKSTSSSEVRIIQPFSRQPAPPSAAATDSFSPCNQARLVECVAKLAAENLQESCASPTIVAESLHVLSTVCLHCTSLQCQRLESVVVKEALSSLLRQTKHPTLLVEAQRLCTLLILHRGTENRLCNKSEYCVVYAMYRLCTDPAIEKLSSVATTLYSQHISFLSSLASQTRVGLGGLLVNACPCSNELITSTILAMYKLYKIHINKSTNARNSSATDHSPDDSLFPVLLQGVLVLHCLAQTDSTFLQRHGPVQLSFVRLLSGLSALLRPIRSSWEWHATVLDELCDFEPEFHDGSSQDSEGEERMDQA